MYLIIFHYYINNQSILLEIEWSLSDCRIWNICFSTAVLYYVTSHRQVFDKNTIYCANSYKHVLNSVHQTVTDMCLTAYSKQLQTCVQQCTANSYKYVFNSVRQTVTDMCLTANSYKHVFNSVQRTATDMCLTANSYRHVINSIQRTVKHMCLTAYSEQLQTCD